MSPAASKKPPKVEQSKTERYKTALVKRLRKRQEKTIHDLAEELSVTRQSLVRALAELVAEGEAVAHEHGRKPRGYTKP